MNNIKNMRARVSVRVVPTKLYSLISGLILAGISSASAQTLDQQIRNLLEVEGGQNVCGKLVGNSARDSQTLLPLNFGPQLAGLCRNIAVSPEPPPMGAGPGGGAQGGAGSTAFSALGQADQVLKKRRLRTGKNEAPPAGGASGDADRMTLASNINLFFNADYRELDRRQTVSEQGYNSDEKGFTLGMDTMPADWLLAGVAFNYAHWRGEQINGGFETDSYGPTVFASLFPWQGFFADLSFQYTRKDGSSRNQRNYTRNSTLYGGAISGSPGADQYEGNFSTGYDYAIGGLTIGPRATVRYRHANMDAYTEHGGSGLELRFQEDKLSSLQSSIGAQASFAISTGWGVLVPQINADWTHEYGNGQRSIFVQFAQDNRPVPTTFGFQTDKPDRDFFHLGTGLVAVLPNGWQAFANFETLLGHAYFDNYVGTLGIRLGL